MSATALTNLFGSVGSTLFNNMNVEQQIDAQRYENQETRKYNLELAKQQNQWNIEQWNRENLYNSPQQQMARYRAAGLNPNLIYGQQNTSAQLSGSMSAGAPGTPVDMSPMGRKKSVFGSVMDAIKNNPFLEEQLRSIRLDNDDKEIKLNESKYQQEVRRFIRNLNYSPSSLESLLNFGAGNDEWQNSDGVDPMYNNPDVRKYLMDYSKYHDGFRISKETADSFITKAIAESNIADSKAEEVRKILASTIDAINKRNANEVDFSKMEKELGLSSRAVSILKMIVELVK